MDVKVKDRKDEIEMLRIACNMVEIGIEYQHADLIIKIQKRLTELGDKFSIKDAVEIHYNWKEEWRKYFENQVKSRSVECNEPIK